MASRLLAYLQLFRLPNVFTAMADIGMGFLFVQGSAQPVGSLLLLLAASSLLYTAGMVLNDVFDVEIDRQQRPHRPLPSGRIDVALAKKLGMAMLGLGVLAALCVGPQAAGIAGCLAIAVYVYDGVAKPTPLAPVVMGSCRFFNVLLGMSLAAPLWTPTHLCIAGGLGIYVAGITWFARSEAGASDRRLLGFGLGVMIVGVSVLAAAHFVSGRELALKAPGLLPVAFVWPAFLALIVFSVVRRCLIALSDPSPSHVQQAVKHAILSLVVLDAGVVLAFVGPAPALAVLALLVPTMFLGRWIYST